MTQPLKENQVSEASENESIFARGRRALSVATVSAMRKVENYMDGLGEETELENKLFQLAGSGNTKSLHALLEAGVDPRAPSQSKIGTSKAWTPLHRSLANNDEDSSLALVKSIRARFSSVETAEALNMPEGQFGDSPLMMAVKLDQHRTVNALLTAGGDPAQPNKEGVTPFMEMCRRGHLEMIGNTLEVLDQGRATAMLHKVDNAGFNSLFHAIAGGAQNDVKKNVVAVHAAHQFDCAGKYGPEGYSAVHVASLVGNSDLIRSLVDNFKGDVNSLSTKEGLTPMMVAAWNNQPDSVQELVRSPSLYINARRNEDGTTALHIAAVRVHHEAIIALVQCQADLHVKNAQNQTPADLAKYLGHNETAHLLKRLDPESDTNSSLTQSLLQRASNTMGSMKSGARAAPTL